MSQIQTLQNKDLQERIDYLEEEVAYLKSMIWEDVVIPSEWKLTSYEVTVVAVLVNQTVATRSACMTALYYDKPEDEPYEKIIDILIHRIRKKISPFGWKIKTYWGHGWWLSDRDRKAIAGGAVYAGEVNGTP